MKPKHVLEFFRNDQWWVRILALLVDRLTVPKICLAVISFVGSVSVWKGFS